MPFLLREDIRDDLENLGIPAPYILRAEGEFRKVPLIPKHLDKSTYSRFQRETKDSHGVGSSSFRRLCEVISLVSGWKLKFVDYCRPEQRDQLPRSFSDLSAWNELLWDSQNLEVHRLLNEPEKPRSFPDHLEATGDPQSESQSRADSEMVSASPTRHAFNDNPSNAEPEAPRDKSQQGNRIFKTLSEPHSTAPSAPQTKTVAIASHSALLPQLHHISPGEPVEPTLPPTREAAVSPLLPNTEPLTSPTDDTPSPVTVSDSFPQSPTIFDHSTPVFKTNLGSPLTVEATQNAIGTDVVDALKTSHNAPSSTGSGDAPLRKPVPLYLVLLVAPLLIAVASFIVWKSLHHAQSTLSSRVGAQAARLDIRVIPRGTDMSIPLDEAPLPIAAGDSLQFHATSIQPQYFYILWLDANGVVNPVWPWDNMKWESKLDEHSHTSLSFPQGLTHFKLQVDTHGIHSVILLASPKPLADLNAFKIELESLNCRLPGLPAIENQLLVSMTNGTVRESKDRFPILPKQTTDASHPVLQLQQALRSALFSQGLSTHAISFAFGDR